MGKAAGGARSIPQGLKPTHFIGFIGTTEQLGEKLEIGVL
jgi:hypothetical protein